MSKTMTVTPEMVALSLYDCGMVQFGDFTLSSGEKSPVYLDLRLLSSYPNVLREISHLMTSLVDAAKFDRIAAIPLAGLPIGTALSLASDRPLIYPRPEQKAHGGKKSVEGVFEAGQTVLLVDDVISEGASKLQAIKTLTEAGLKVTDLLVIVERNMGGSQALAAEGIKVHHLLTLPQILTSLTEAGRLPEARRDEIMRWLEERRK